MIVTRRTYRKRSLEFVSTAELQNVADPNGAGTASSRSGRGSMPKGKLPTPYHQAQEEKQPQQPPDQKPRAPRAPESAPPSSSISSSKAPPSSAGSVASRISRKRILTRRRPKASSSSSDQPACSRPVVLLPLPLLHLGNRGAGGFRKQKQQPDEPYDDKAWDHRAAGIESDYSSDDSSAHSLEYYRELQQQTLPPPPTTLAVAQLIEDKVMRLQADRAKQMERQRRVQEEREKGVWMSYNIRLSIYLQAKRAEVVKQAAAMREEEVKQAAEIAAIKAEQFDEAAINLPQNMAVLERDLRFAKHRAKRDEIDNGHINIHKNKAALQDQLQFSQHRARTFKEVEIASHAPIILKKAKVPKEEKVEFDKIGKLAPSLASMIAQAALELRPIPKEHKKEFKPICNDAAEIGKLMRLKEKVVEAQGTRTGEELEKIFKKEVASTTIKAWTKGMGTVTLPKFDNARSEAFNIVNEAAALGRLVALKPKVTRNYDEELDYVEDEEDDVDVLAVDLQGHKDFRMKYLTEVHVRQHQKEKKKSWDITNIDQTIHDDLDKVELPTGALPVYNRPRKQLSMQEIKEGIAQGVAEKLWERQYRLERPEAELRMRPACACNYCKTSNPYQTHAYRKKWLIRQGLWVEPVEESEPRQAKSRPDPLVHLRKRLVVEKKKEEEIRREAERQQWLAESKDLYSKCRLRQIVEKEAPVLDPTAEAVEQRKENLAVAHQRAKVVKQKTVPVPVALGESVSARKKKLFQTGMSENGKKEISAIETTWERDHKGRWLARTGGEEKPSRTPEWVNNTVLRHVSPKSKTKALPPIRSSASPNSTEKGNLTSAEPVSPLKPVTNNSLVVALPAQQPAKRRMEFLKIHLKPPSMQLPWSPKSSKNSKATLPKPSPRQSPRATKVMQQKKPTTKKSLQEQLVEKRREILKAPSVPKDVRLKPVAKLPTSLKEVPTQPAEKNVEFINVHLKPLNKSNWRVKSESRSVPVPVMPDLLTEPREAKTTTPATDDYEEDEFVEEEWSGSNEAGDASVYDDDEIVEETIHEEDYVDDADDEDYTEIVDDDEEDYTEVVEESENRFEEASMVEVSASEHEADEEAYVNDGNEENDDFKEYDDDDSSSYHSHGANVDGDGLIVDQGYEEHQYQPAAGADSAYLTSAFRRQSIQLINDIREIMEEGYRGEQAQDSSAFEDSGIQSSSMHDDSGILGLSEVKHSDVQESSSMLDDRGIQGSSKVEETGDSGNLCDLELKESGSRLAQEEHSSMETPTQDGNNNVSTKGQWETAEGRTVPDPKVDDVQMVQFSVSDKDLPAVEQLSSLQAPHDTPNQSTSIHLVRSTTKNGRGRITNDRKKGKKGMFQQLGSTFGSILGR